MRRFAVAAVTSLVLVVGLAACSSSKPTITATTTTSTTQMGGMKPGDTMSPNGTMP